MPKNDTRTDVIRTVSKKLSQDYGFSCTLDNISRVLGFKGNTSSHSGNFAYASLALNLYEEGYRQFLEEYSPANEDEEAIAPSKAHDAGIDYVVRKLEKRKDPALYQRFSFHPGDSRIIETVTAELIRRGLGKTPYEVCVATGHQEITRYEGKILELVRGEKKRYIKEVPADDHYDPEPEAEGLAIIKVTGDLYMTARLNQ